MAIEILITAWSYLKICQVFQYFTASIAWNCTKLMCHTVIEQGIALTGRNRNGPPYWPDRPRARRPATGSVTDDDR